MTLIERLQDKDKCMDAVDDAINRIIILESRLKESQAELQMAGSIRQKLESRLAESSEAWQTLNNENCHLKTELAEKDGECEGLRERLGLWVSGARCSNRMHMLDSDCGNCHWCVNKQALTLNQPLEDGTSTEMLAKVTENEEGELG